MSGCVGSNTTFRCSMPVRAIRGASLNDLGESRGLGENFDRLEASRNTIDGHDVASCRIAAVYTDGLCAGDFWAGIANQAGGRIRIVEVDIVVAGQAVNRPSLLYWQTQ